MTWLSMHAVLWLCSKRSGRENGQIALLNMVDGQYSHASLFLLVYGKILSHFGWLISLYTCLYIYMCVRGTFRVQCISRVLLRPLFYIMMFYLTVSRICIH